MPDSPSSFTPPSWLLSAVAALAMTIAGWAWALSITQESRLTKLETWRDGHEVWSERRSQSTNARVDEMGRTQNQQTEDIRKVLADLREDMGAIRGALNIPKSK